MLRFLLSRLLLILLVLLLANAAGFVLPSLISWGQQTITAEQLNGRPPPLPPLLGPYLQYLSGALRGDFGSLPYAVETPVSEVVLAASAASLGLLGIAVLLSVLLGMLLGMLAVRVEPPGVALWLTSLTTIGLAMPAFYVGSLLIAGTLLWIIYGPFGAGSNPLPIQGFGWDAHLVLPTLVLILGPTARIAQVTATLLTGELSKQYVVAARSFGHSWGRIVRHHALRNVLAAVIVAIAGSLRLLVGELIIVERLFDWPGLGQQIADTMITSPLVGRSTGLVSFSQPLLAALLTVFAAIFLLADLLAALAARALDPRLRI